MKKIKLNYKYINKNYNKHFGWSRLCLNCWNLMRIRRRWIWRIYRIWEVFEKTRNFWWENTVSIRKTNTLINFISLHYRLKKGINPLYCLNIIFIFYFLFFYFIIYFYKSFLIHLKIYYKIECGIVFYSEVKSYILECF